MPDLRLLPGVKITVEAVGQETVPGTPSTVPKLNGSIGSLKVTLSVVVTGTPVAPSVGVVDTTVGGVVSSAEAVVKLQEYGDARVLPVKFAPLTVAV